MAPAEIRERTGNPALEKNHRRVSGGIDAPREPEKRETVEGTMTRTIRADTENIDWLYVYGAKAGIYKMNDVLTYIRENIEAGNKQAMYALAGLPVLYAKPLKNKHLRKNVYRKA